jgi:predicted NUDIX family NTP pyrophosphohydrolase
LVIYRFRGEDLQIFLAHPGGPFFKHKDDGHWTIPKGEVESGEDLLAAAIREVSEEVGISFAASSKFQSLGSIRQKGGKTVQAWAVEEDWDDTKPFQSNVFTMAWPPGSGRKQEFPEVDRAQYFSFDEAKRKVKQAQAPLLERLQQHLTERRF